MSDNKWPFENDRLVLAMKDKERRCEESNHFFAGLDSRCNCGKFSNLGGAVKPISATRLTAVLEIIDTRADEMKTCTPSLEIAKSRLEEKLTEMLWETDHWLKARIVSLKVERERGKSREMRCPNCLSDNLTYAVSINRQPHGETFEQDFLICAICGGRFEESDAVTIPEIIVQRMPMDVIAVEEEKANG